MTTEVLERMDPIGDDEQTLVTLSVADQLCGVPVILVTLTNVTLNPPVSFQTSLVHP